MFNSNNDAKPLHNASKAKNESITFEEKLIHNFSNSKCDQSKMSKNKKKVAIPKMHKKYCSFRVANKELKKVSFQNDPETIPSKSMNSKYFCKSFQSKNS